jgi:hypothetical protein
MDMGMLVADVEFAVFAPGFYPGADPSGGTNYVYAYQVMPALDTDGTTILGSTYVSWYSVGLDGDENPSGIGPDPTQGVLGGQAPDTSGFQGTPITTALWEYIPTVLNVHTGAYSEVLLFTSPYGPEWDNASVSGGFGLQDMESLPSPAPEPMTVLLIGLGVGALWAKRHGGGEGR